MRILVVDDEPKLAAYLRQGLTEQGYVVDTAGTGIDALHMAIEDEYDLLILDVMMPHSDGFAVLLGLRAVRQTPVLMLTARDSIEDRVRGLRAGADDYLVKPFAFDELLARVQALLRRGRPAADGGVPTVLTLADLSLDLVKRKAHRGEARLDLTAKEFTLLTVLLQSTGEVLSRTVLASRVWDVNFDSNTNVVEVAIRRLRAKLDDPFPQPLLHTVRGMGYVLESRAP